MRIVYKRSGFIDFVSVS